MSLTNFQHSWKLFENSFKNFSTFTNLAYNWLREEKIHFTAINLHLNANVIHFSPESRSLLFILFSELNCILLSLEKWTSLLLNCNSQNNIIFRFAVWKIRIIQSLNFFNVRDLEDLDLTQIRDFFGSIHELHRLLECCVVSQLTEFSHTMLEHMNASESKSPSVQPPIPQAPLFSVNLIDSSDEANQTKIINSENSIGAELKKWSNAQNSDDSDLTTSSFTSDTSSDQEEVVESHFKHIISRIHVSGSALTFPTNIPTNYFVNPVVENDMLNKHSIITQGAVPPPPPENSDADQVDGNTFELLSTHIRAQDRKLEQHLETLNQRHSEILMNLSSTLSISSSRIRSSLMTCLLFKSSNAKRDAATSRYRSFKAIPSFVPLMLFPFFSSHPKLVCHFGEQLENLPPAHYSPPPPSIIPLHIIESTLRTLAPSRLRRQLERVATLTGEALVCLKTGVSLMSDVHDEELAQSANGFISGDTRRTVRRAEMVLMETAHVLRTASRDCEEAVSQLCEFATHVQAGNVDTWEVEEQRREKELKQKASLIENSFKQGGNDSFELSDNHIETEKEANISAIEVFDNEPKMVRYEADGEGKGHSFSNSNRLACNDEHEFSCSSLPSKMLILKELKCRLPVYDTPEESVRVIHLGKDVSENKTKMEQKDFIREEMESVEEEDVPQRNRIVCVAGVIKSGENSDPLHFVQGFRLPILSGKLNSDLDVIVGDSDCEDSTQ